MAIVQNNFLTALGESIVRTNRFYEMRFGTGTGTESESLAIAGLFNEVYSELISAAGNSSLYKRFNNAVDILFTILMDTTEGNGTGFNDYTECGLFDQDGNKLVHVVFNQVVRKDSGGSLTFKYVMSLGQK